MMTSFSTFKPSTFIAQSRWELRHNPRFFRYSEGKPLLQQRLLLTVALLLGAELVHGQEAEQEDGEEGRGKHSSLAHTVEYYTPFFVGALIVLILATYCYCNVRRAAVSDAPEEDQAVGREEMKDERDDTIVSWFREGRLSRSPTVESKVFDVERGIPFRNKSGKPAQSRTMAAPAPPLPRPPRSKSSQQDRTYTNPLANIGVKRGGNKLAIERKTDSNGNNVFNYNSKPRVKGSPVINKDQGRGKNDTNDRSRGSTSSSRSHNENRNKKHSKVPHGLSPPSKLPEFLPSPSEAGSEAFEVRGHGNRERASRDDVGGGTLRIMRAESRDLYSSGSALGSARRRSFDSKHEAEYFSSISTHSSSESSCRSASVHPSDVEGNSVMGDTVSSGGSIFDDEDDFEDSDFHRD